MQSLRDTGIRGWILCRTDDGVNGLGDGWYTPCTEEGLVEPRHPSTKLTYAELELLPDDGLRHEIIDGEHYVTASPLTRHQRISRRLLVAIQSYLDAHPLGEVFHAPVDVVMSFHDVVVPDLIYVSAARAGLVTAKNLQGAPDLVIEILSPSTRAQDERLKRDLYERAGVEEYWLVDPDRNTVTILRRRGPHFLPPKTFETGSIVSTPLLPGFELPLERALS
jgi:Uma2 family endonuclease